MSGPAILAMVAAVGIASIIQIFTDPRITKTFVARSLVAIAVYAGHVAVGLVVILYLLPGGPNGAVGATMALVGWIGLGALGLMRFAPRLKESPAWLMRFGTADMVCLAVIAIGLVLASGAF